MITCPACRASIGAIVRDCYDTYETADGKIEMMPSAKTHNVKEPPHWMLMWPLDPAKTGLPTRPNASGAYVMFAGTPYAHVMVYENPARMKNLAGKGSSSKS